MSYIVLNVLFRCHVAMPSAFSCCLDRVFASLSTVLAGVVRRHASRHAWVSGLAPSLDPLAGLLGMFTGWFQVIMQESSLRASSSVRLT